MTTSLWSSDQIDLLKIGAPLNAGRISETTHLNRGDGGWVAGVYWDASSDASEPQKVSPLSVVDVFSHSHARVGDQDVVSGESFAAPETFGASAMADISVMDTPAVAGPSIDATVPKAFESVELTDLPRRLSNYMSASPPATSDIAPDSPYSSCVSDTSNTAYPTAIADVFTNLSHPSSFVAEPLVPASTTSYADFFENPSETLCLFNDVEAQYYPSLLSPALSSSPAPTTSTANPTPIVANYSGPIKNQIVNMYQDKDGVVWIMFPYSKNKEVKNHLIRCDVEKVPPSALREEIKTVSAAAYPQVGAIILGQKNFNEYGGKRFGYEWDCCWLGWSLAQLNPTLLEQKGLLQRATDNVASFVFEGCMSRTKLKSHRNERHRARDAELPLHQWEQYMVPRPEWLPGLDQDKVQKERLKSLFQATKKVYDDNLPVPADQASPKMKKLASDEAVKFYMKHVTGATMSPSREISQSERMTPQAEASRTPVGTSGAMNYINIPADPHADDSQQIRINVLLDKVRDNVISDSVRQEGMVYIDVFETENIADADLKKSIETKKSMLHYYRNNPIGLVGPGIENLPPLPDLIRTCGLDIDEYNRNWHDFQWDLNQLGFKIKYVDTNNRHQKITDPLLMQRVLYEILRRTNENMEKIQPQSRKRKAETQYLREDGKFAERLFTKETRGPRPGMVNWTPKRRKAAEEWELSDLRRAYLTGH